MGLGIKEEKPIKNLASVGCVKKRKEMGLASNDAKDIETVIRIWIGWLATRSLKSGQTHHFFI